MATSGRVHRVKNQGGKQVVRSTVKPQQIWLRRKDGNILTLRVRWNIHTAEVEDMEGETHTEYEYEEREIRHTLPDDITTVTAFKRYMKDKVPELLAQAKAVVVEEKPKLWELQKLSEIKILQTETLSLEVLREAIA